MSLEGTRGVHYMYYVVYLPNTSTRPWEVPTAMREDTACKGQNIKGLIKYMIPGLTSYESHIDGLVQDYSISIAKALEILQSCTNMKVTLMA